MTKSVSHASSYVPRRFTDQLEGKEGQILHAAFQCVVEKGFAATSTRAIATRAGLNQGIIHYYFMSKEDLMNRLMETLFQTFITNIETIARCPLSPIERLETMIESGYTFMDSRRDEFIVMIAFWAHAISVGGEMLNLFKKLFTSFREAVNEALGEGKRPSETELRVREHVALLIVAGVQGIGLQYALEPNRHKVESSKAFMKDLLRYAIKKRV
jgi:AcrR family transcriptional regulator